MDRKVKNMATFSNRAEVLVTLMKAVRIRLRLPRIPELKIKIH